MENVWLVGKHTDYFAHVPAGTKLDRWRTNWEVQGVYATQGEADAACRNKHWFVMRVPFGVALPDETVAPSGDPAAANYSYNPAAED